MSTPTQTPTPLDLLLEIDVQGGDAGLLRVISTLHHRHAHVRFLSYEGREQVSHVRVRVAVESRRCDHLISALDGCVDVLSVVRVPTLETTTT